MHNTITIDGHLIHKGDSVMFKIVTHDDRPGVFRETTSTYVGWVGFISEYGFTLTDAGGARLDAIGRSEFENSKATLIDHRPGLNTKGRN